VDALVYDAKNQQPLQPDDHKEHQSCQVKIADESQEDYVRKPHTEHVDHETDCPHVYILSLRVRLPTKAVERNQKGHARRVIREKHEHREVSDPLSC
jgi:hypothetical protein